VIVITSAESKGRDRDWQSANPTIWPHFAG